MVIVCLNGRYLKEREARISIRDSGFLYGEGIYETLRTVDGKVFNEESHLARLRKSAEFLGIELPEDANLMRWLQGVVDRNKLKEARIRLTVTGGEHGFNEASKKPTILVTAVSLQEVPAAKLKRGVSVVSVKMERCFPQIKTTHLLPAMLSHRAMDKARAYEALLVNDRGYVTEGTITNVFIVRRRRLITPKSSMLKGTTRARILKVARKLKMKVERKDFRIWSVYAADEVFICNAPRGIIPVVKVDGRVIGNGKPGEVTQQLMQSLNFGLEK